jgi:aminoglycoside phosphotransferase (APT) family kinase protein
LTLVDLLREHGLANVPQTPLTNAGYSGSALFRLIRDDGAAFILKRMSTKRDWIMRATADADCREARLATASPVFATLVLSPNVGTSRDGDEYSLLMRDISDRLLGEEVISEPQLNTIIERMAELHRFPSPMGVPWCDVRRRLMLLTPRAMQEAGAGSRLSRDVTDGWLLFEVHATARATQLIHGLFRDPTPLLRALEAQPSAFLHGDLKLDNIGLGAERSMWLIDWAMTLVAPPAVELGWFLAVNSRRLPV